MKFTDLLTVSVVFFMGFQAQAALPWTPEGTSYLNGTEVCARHQEERDGELPLWVNVPVNYQDSSQGTFPLYAWTKAPLDPQKKVMIFVAGGPGDTSHSSSMALEDWNVVFFDQRGNSCSRPTTAKQYLDRNFYSSENTARDIDEIRKHLGVDAVSVYGVSYGTVPAHLYGSLFKEHARAVVVEGVIFQSDEETLIENPRRRKILQRFFNSLPLKTQDRILELSQKPGVPDHWFSNVGKMMLYLDNSLAAFSQFLEGVIWSDETLAGLLPSFEEHTPQDNEFGFSQVMMNMLACKELGMNTPGASFSSVFKGRTLVAEKNNSLRETNCLPLGFTEADTTDIFKASNHPVYVPITYFQGTLDGATAAPQAVKSFKTAARGAAHLVLVRNGGHLPLQGPLSSGYETGAPLELRKKALYYALDGLAVPTPLLKDLSQTTEMGWLRVSK